MSTTNLDSADLKAVARGGLIHEDVMSRIWDISKIPLPLQDLIGSATHVNEYKEWTQDTLGAVNLSNAAVDGADASGNNTAVGKRVGNHSQISTKVVRVSDRANNSKTIGFADTLAYQIMMRQQELHRDVDAIALTNQVSIADDGSAVAGLSGGLRAWIATNDLFGVGGVSGGYSTGTGLVVAATVGQQQGITETLIRDAAQACYVAGSNPNTLMATPQQIRNISGYMFTSSARVANLQRETKGEMTAASALGSVNVFITDFGVSLEFVPNRLQNTYSSIGGTVATVGNVFILDPTLLMISYLQGYQVMPLARTGTADNRQMSVDWTLVVGNEAGLAVIADVNPLTAMVA